MKTLTPSPRIQTQARTRRYLVVANLTLGSEQLTLLIQRRLQRGPCSFHVVVPASPDPNTMTWAEGDVRRAARSRLDQALSMFRILHADVTGEVGDGMPLLAIEDAVRTETFDEIIVSTLPPGASRWIGLDLPTRIAGRFGVPVTHVTSSIDSP
jgi:GABA permease